jgi:hypothetical protein
MSPSAPVFWSIFGNGERLCLPYAGPQTRGLILIMVPYRWSFHAYPSDYWRYSPDDVSEISTDCQILNLEKDPAPPSLVYVKIRKPIGFVEKDLPGYGLYSIIAGRRMDKWERRHFATAQFARLNWGYCYEQINARMLNLLIHLKRELGRKANEYGGG